MLDDLENDFMGSKDSNSSFIEKYMEVGNLVTVVTLVTVAALVTVVTLVTCLETKRNYITRPDLH